VSGALLLTGDDLTVEDVWDVAVGGRRAAIAVVAYDRISAARALLESLSGEHTYGVNTGFGRFVSESIPADQSEELQLRLLRSHACGVGEPYPDEVVRAAMLLRANALAKGFSGARVETVELLLACLNGGVLPHVPSRGSVGGMATSFNNPGTDAFAGTNVLAIVIELPSSMLGGTKLGVWGTTSRRES